MQSQRSSAEEIQELQRTILALKADKESLLKELGTLCEKLAQHSILHHAQERQIYNSLTTQQHAMNHKERAIIETTAKCNQLQEQCDRINQEKLDLLLKKKELQAKILEQGMKQEEMQAVLATTQEDNNLLQSNNLHLQSVVDTLGKSYQSNGAFDTNMVAEFERYRKEQSRKEEGFVKLIESLKEQLKEEAMNRDQLLDDLHAYRKDLHDKNSLLQQIQHDYRNNSTMSLAISNVSAMTERDEPRHQQQHLQQKEGKVDEKILLGDSAHVYPSCHHAASVNGRTEDASQVSASADGGSQVSWLMRTETG